jgi:hypothetical protein
VIKSAANSKTAAVAYPVSEDEEEGSTASAANEKPASGEGSLAFGYPVPKPRAKPIEVLLLAASKMRIEPASAPVPRNNFAKRPAPSKRLQTGAAEKLLEAELISANPLKSSFAARAQHEQTDLVTASITPGTSADDFFWWPTRWLLNAGSFVRRDAPSEPVDITFASLEKTDAPPVQKVGAIPWGLGDFIALLQGIKSDSGTAGKSDRLFVNRNLKGDIQANARKNPARIGQADLLLDASAKPTTLR